MFKKLKKRRLQKLRDGLRDITALRVGIWCVMLTLDDDNLDAKKEGREIIDELMIDAEKLNRKIARIG